MAGDLGIIERAAIESPELGAESALGELGRVIHQYGRLKIFAIPEEAEKTVVRSFAPVSPQGLTELEQLGLAALQLRESPQYRTAKENRPREGERWDMQCTTEAPLSPGAAVAPAALTSDYLEGTVAVGIIIVQGPTDDLEFSEEERVKVVAEVQNGLGFYATTNPVAGISFTYDIQIVTVNVPPDPNATGREALEALWRDPALAALGYSAGLAGATDYIEDIRNRFGTQWTYCAFFTKYRLQHYAYASIGGPRVVMHYDNGNWGVDNIDRVFAHETGHIFGAPDEYVAMNSQCTCGGTWGRFGIGNWNCDNCPIGGDVPCLMKGNNFIACGYTPGHLGWALQLLVRNFGYSDAAGSWRGLRHPRFLANLRDLRFADIVGFGSAGVWVSFNNGDGTFQPPVRVVDNFGYSDAAGSWRVLRHPRFLADLTGDGRADIVGFGSAGVWVSFNNGDGTFRHPELVVENFGYSDAAGSWRVERHPRFLANLRDPRNADIVGFGTAGVWVSFNNGDGTFRDPELVVENFGYGDDAGSWRVDRHPRFLANLTDLRRPDIVGFGTAGVWVSFNNGDGTFRDPELVVDNFGYSDAAGSWRVDRHPRFLADLTGDGIADIVGFGTEGVWVSFSNGDGTFRDPELVVENFGYSDAAGSWRVPRHPRFLATLRDRFADIVGFGSAGVWVSFNNGDGTFRDPELVVENFGYSDAAGSWRVGRHPRFLADLTGDGRADIVGFGSAGVWMYRF